MIELLKKKIFKFVNKKNVFENARVFNPRFVNEIKNADIEKAFEKSRIVIQVYNDFTKDQILIQLSTIQQIS